MTMGSMYGSSPEVDFFSLHNRKNKPIDVDMLDYGYVAKCTDLDELKGILAMLRSGKEGRYPHLEQVTEDRILAVLPVKERVKIQRMRAGPTGRETQTEKELLASWTSEMDEMHQSLQDHKARRTTRRLPPVRGQESAMQQREPAASLLISEVKEEKKAIPAYDFRAWEKYDVAEAINAIDEQDQQDQQQVQRTWEQKTKRDTERKKELASLPDYVDLDALSVAERKVLARVEKDKGNDSFRANENEEAVLYYTRSIAFNDAEAALYSNRAAAHLRLKNFAQAEQDCTRAIQLNPTYCKAWRRRGMTFFRRGKYADAIDDFEHSQELEPGNQEVEKLLKKTRAKWQEVDGTVNMTEKCSNDQEERKPAPSQPQPTGSQQWTSTENLTPFTRFEIIEEDDEDDDANAPNQPQDEEDAAEKPFQRFEIIED